MGDAKSYSNFEMKETYTEDSPPRRIVKKQELTTKSAQVLMQNAEQLLRNRFMNKLKTKSKVYRLAVKVTYRDVDQLLGE